MPCNCRIAFLEEQADVMKEMIIFHQVKVFINESQDANSYRTVSEV